MANARRNTEAAQRMAARRQREEESPRLRAEIPRLQSLKLEIDEKRGEVLAGAAHVRHIVVDHAPALFVLHCSDRDCKDGGHDVTREVMAALRRGETTFEGSHVCDGRVGPRECGAMLRYVGSAVYRPD